MRPPRLADAALMMQLGCDGGKTLRSSSGYALTLRIHDSFCRIRNLPRAYLLHVNARICVC